MGGAVSCRPEENPTMKAIEEQYRREEEEREAQAEKLKWEQEAAQKAARLAKKRERKKAQAEKLKKEQEAAAEKLEREKKTQAEQLKRERETAQKAAWLAKKQERKKKAQDKRIKVQQGEAQRAAENTRRLEREMQEQIEVARREHEAAQRATVAANELQVQVWKKEEEAKKAIEEQKAMDAKWKTSIQPVEWPSKETFEATKLRFYKAGKFHLAIAGISGTGKSSLINAFRGIWDHEEGAAKTDFVEGTSVVTSYPDPDPAKPLIWFDVPGSGTLACSDWTYFNDQGLYIFDAIIVLFNDRFTAMDVAILKNCERYNIPTYIVRSKSDTHIEDIIKKKTRAAGAKANPAEIRNEAREEYLTRTQDSVRENLTRSDPQIRSHKMYAVSRDTLTAIIREEPLRDDCFVLNERELLRDILQDGYSRRLEKSYGRMSDVVKKTGVRLIQSIDN
ncbi:interferon-inducible GTPase-domain-containing protein [Armillaria mellea]|nr:interferon-inducible GTPase-domain-containing protein [Armillaria mellea]